MSSPDRRLLLVHAHPDDESIYTGATMAKYAAEGARVTLVTCTPSAAYLAIVAPVVIDSSSGCACTRSRRRSGELMAVSLSVGRNWLDFST